MKLDFIVSKVVRTEKQGLFFEWRVHLKTQDGDRLTLCFNREEETRGYKPGMTQVMVEVVNPQQTLEASQ